MIAQRLLDELQQLNREKKLEVVQHLNEESSDEMKQYLGSRRAFKIPPRFIASDGGAAMRRVLLERGYRVSADPGSVEFLRNG